MKEEKREKGNRSRDWRGPQAIKVLWDDGVVVRGESGGRQKEGKRIEMKDEGWIS